VKKVIYFFIIAHICSNSNNKINKLKLWQKVREGGEISMTHGK